MRPTNWKDIAELSGIAAIVVSLIFVGFQMRQAQVIANAELTSESFNLVIGFNQSLMDPSFAGTYVKMLDNPEGLTVEEMVQIDALLDSLMMAYRRECFLEDTGMFEGCVKVIEVTAERFFGNKYAQSWLRVQGQHFRIGLYKRVDTFLANLEANSHRRRLEEPKEGL